MDAQATRDMLDARTRHVLQTTKDWLERPPRLAAAIEAARVALDIGASAPLAPALAELEAAWANAQQ